MIFLGHMVSRNGIFVDPRKVETIVNWECLKNITEIQSFLGLGDLWSIFHESLHL